MKIGFRLIVFQVLLAWVFLPSPALAGLSSQIAGVIASGFPPAEDHPALRNAAHEPDPAKMRAYVVLKQGGIPAERARHLIGWQEYDYRGAVVDCAGSDEGKVSTRRGPVYTHLQPGDVMAVVGRKEFNNTIYLLLQSADVYVPEDRAEEKRHSRVTVMLGFKFPRSVFREDDAGFVASKIDDWLAAFSNVEEARAFARTITISTSGS